MYGAAGWDHLHSETRENCNNSICNFTTKHPTCLGSNVNWQTCKSEEREEKPASVMSVIQQRLDQQICASASPHISSSIALQDSLAQWQLVSTRASCVPKAPLRRSSLSWTCERTSRQPEANLEDVRTCTCHANSEHPSSRSQHALAALPQILDWLQLPAEQGQT